MTSPSVEPAVSPGAKEPTKQGSLGRSRTRNVLRIIRRIVNRELWTDLAYYLTGGRFHFIPDAACWWIVVPARLQLQALTNLQILAASDRWAGRHLRAATNLYEALKAIGFEPRLTSAYENPIESPALRYLSGSPSPRVRERRTITILYLDEELTVQAPDKGSLILNRGSWNQRRMKRMSEIDLLVLHALAPFVQIGSVAHSPDGARRYMFQRGELIKRDVSHPDQVT